MFNITLHLQLLLFVYVIYFRFLFQNVFNFQYDLFFSQILIIIPPKNTKEKVLESFRKKKPIFSGFNLTFELEKTLFEQIDNVDGFSILFFSLTLKINHILQSIFYSSLCFTFFLISLLIFCSSKIFYFFRILCVCFLCSCVIQL